ncbi:MAG: hypothetical protein KDD54_12890, partial [Flavobacteriales bacterium]|nr:hypothetical protein [Flavobacteriales bacterium]
MLNFILFAWLQLNTVLPGDSISYVATPDRQWPLQGEQLYADETCNVYLVKGDQLLRWPMDYPHQVVNYSLKNAGHPTFVDVSNPLKPMLYFGNFSQIQYLDRQLSAQGTPISLDEIGYPAAQWA